MSTCTFNSKIPSHNPLNTSYLGFNLPSNVKKQWHLGYQDKTSSIRIMEWIPNNQTISNWQEMITAQATPHINISVKQYYEQFLEELKKSSSIVESTLITNTISRIMFEWWIPNDQHELMLIEQNNGEFFLLHYVTKDLSNIEELKAKYFPMLREARVILYSFDVKS